MISLLIIPNAFITCTGLTKTKTKCNSNLVVVVLSIDQRPAFFLLAATVHRALVVAAGRRSPDGTDVTALRHQIEGAPSGGVRRVVLRLYR